MMDSAQIGALEERRQAQMLASVAPLVRRFAGGVMGFHEIGSWQNQASGAGLDGPVTDDDIDAMVEFYVSRGVEPRVELSPFAHPTLIEGLAARRFVVREFEHVLARELPAGEDLQARLPFGRPAGLELEIVDKSDAAAIEAAVTATMRGFYPDGEPPQAMLDACRSTLLLDGTLTFLARVDGELAAAGSLSCGSQVASLMGVSTATAFRRRGIQQALIVARLAAARERGCVLVTIGSRPGMPTERNAMRLGFRVAYTKVIVAQPGEGLARSV
jgi:GNAT superfamily N-acetyltransferase